MSHMPALALGLSCRINTDPSRSRGLDSFTSSGHMSLKQSSTLLSPPTFLVNSRLGTAGSMCWPNALYAVGNDGVRTFVGPPDLYVTFRGRGDGLDELRTSYPWVSQRTLPSSSTLYDGNCTNLRSRTAGNKYDTYLTQFQLRSEHHPSTKVTNINMGDINKELALILSL